MDYKFIILLLVIIGLIIFFTRELDNIKCEISEKLDKIASHVDNSSRHTLGKLQNDFSVCVTKMKTINGDYIEQVRKMNDYGNQPITNMSNNYTDTDSQGKGMNFSSLSDCKASVKSLNNVGAKDNSFYLSEEEPKKHDMFCMILPQTQSEKQSEKKPEHKFILSPDLIDDENNHITTESLNSGTSKNKTDKTNKNEIKEHNFNNTTENDNSDESNHSSNHSSNYNRQIQSIQKYEKESDTASVATGNIQKLTIDTFLEKDMYTSEILKKIAKELAIPISQKDGSMRRLLKKDELYDKIKVRLSENK